MRIDAISIFPQFFDVLDISLLGKAKAQDLLGVKIHDLRDFTDDKHRTVDDTPFGGGAGMLMKAEPWGQALDSVVTAETIVIFPSPAGELFKQATAQELSKAKHLVFACGRYEGIDQRVVDYATSKAKVRLVSLGDYVLNGGEVAAVAMIEAIARLIPGVIGNADSLTEESHSDGLLEYPSYTKPSTWRGLEVPEVLLGGNHAEIAKWRKAKALERTQQVRPELLD
jgi:tRNA (guanine37-N1)-methyltransferase